MKEQKLSKLITTSPTSKSSGNVRRDLEDEDKDQVSPAETRSPMRSPNNSPRKIKLRSNSL